MERFTLAYLPLLRARPPKPCNVCLNLFAPPPQRAHFTTESTFLHQSEKHKQPPSTCGLLHTQTQTQTHAMRLADVGQGSKSRVIMLCDTCVCVFPVGAQHGGMLKGSLGRSNRWINITAAPSRAVEGKHQDLHEQTRRKGLRSCAARVSPGHRLDTSRSKMSSELTALALGPLFQADTHF